MRFKKAIVFVLCAILTFSVFACSKAPGGGANGDDETVDPTVEYTVSFDVGADARAAGVSDPESVKVNGGGIIGEMPSPVWEGYVLNGWYDGETLVGGSTRIAKNMTLVAKWVSQDEIDELIAQYENSLTADNGWQPGHLYIHYKRYDHSTSEQGKNNTGAPEYNDTIGSPVYDDWGLWLWPKNDEGRLFHPWRIDVSGAVYDVLLDHTYNDAGFDSDTKQNKGMTISYKENQGNPVTVVGMQLFSIKSRLGSGYWGNDGGNVDLVLADIVREDGTYHWFVTQGHVTTGKPNFTNQDTPNPWKDKKTGEMTTRTSGDGIIDSSKDSEFEKITSRVAGWDEDSVGYQIFIASFCDSDGDGMGDLQGIISKLDYLKGLNVDVLWLTPFQSSTNYHGYDIKDYYSVDSRFGTLEDYRELVYKAHQKGIKIVMDFVLNHTSTANPWFVNSQNLVVEKADDDSEIDYRQFYTWINKEQYEALPEKQRDGLGKNHDGKQWYGPLNGNGDEKDGYYYYSSFTGMPELNYDYQPVRDAIVDVCKYWMAFGLDGFRLDAVKHIYMQNELTGVGKTLSSDVVKDDDDSYNHDRKRNINFYREFNYKLKSAYPNAFVVGENLDGNPGNVAPYYEGIDSQFNFNLYYDAARKIAQMSGIKFNGGQTTDAGWASGFMKNDGDYVKNNNLYKQYNANFIDGQFTSNHDLPRARDRVNIKNTISGDGKIDDEYASLYTNNTIDGKAVTEGTYTHPAGQLDTDAVDKTDALLRLYYAFQMTIPGITWIYYGDEIGMSGVMQYTLDTGSTSTTSSAAHEDRIYRQPMKWYTTETETQKNGDYFIGFEGKKAELIGFNASDALKGVDEQLTDGDSLLSWVKTLTGIRDTYGLGKATVSDGGGAQGMEYTVTGTHGKIRVCIGTGFESNPSGKVLAQYTSKAIGGKTYKVLITEA